MVAFNIQNYYYAKLYGTDETANTAWLRYAQPFGKWLMRASLPIQTVPTGAGQDPVSGLGDFNVFFAYLLSDPSSPKQFGVGPLVAAPPPPTTPSAPMSGRPGPLPSTSTLHLRWSSGAVS